MAACLLCKKDVSAGYVVCGDCAGKLNPGELPPVLSLFTAWLGAEMARDLSIKPCSMCGREHCNDLSQCAQGVTAWLRAKAGEFAKVSVPGILGKLTTICPFPEVYEGVDTTDEPRRKIGHIRADYDNYRWWNTVWPSHWELATDEIKSEMDRTYEALTAGDALHNLDTLRRFCWAHPEAGTGRTTDDEFDFYLVGEACDFWVRLITREKDYNLYLSAYAKADKHQEET